MSLQYSRTQLVSASRCQADEDYYTKAAASYDVKSPNCCKWYHLEKILLSAQTADGNYRAYRI